MDFLSQCQQLSNKIASLKSKVRTEEATKNAFIMPFIQLLGYDVFNPEEVVPEMDCDITSKRADKIDYAIFKDGEPCILIECKPWSKSLSNYDTQLKKYFVASKAKFAILTNGIQYWFYTDLHKPNIMDDEPFFTIDFADLHQCQVEELKKFHKASFDVSVMSDSANELKYLADLKLQFENEMVEPSDEFVRLFARRVYEGTVTQKVLEMFRRLTRKATTGYINDAIANRLNEMMPSEDVGDDMTVDIGDEKMSAYEIVKDIVKQTIPEEQVTYINSQAYFSVVVNNNNKMNICRLHLYKSKKYMRIITNGEDVRYDLSTIQDLYTFTNEIVASAQRYIDN